MRKEEAGVGVGLLVSVHWLVGLLKGRRYMHGGMVMCACPCLGVLREQGRSSFLAIGLLEQVGLVAQGAFSKGGGEETGREGVVLGGLGARL